MSPVSVVKNLKLVRMYILCLNIVSKFICIGKFLRDNSLRSRLLELTIPKISNKLLYEYICLINKKFQKKISITNMKKIAQISVNSIEKAYYNTIFSHFFTAKKFLDIYNTGGCRGPVQKRYLVTKLINSIFLAIYLRTCRCSTTRILSLMSDFLQFSRTR